MIGSCSSEAAGLDRLDDRRARQRQGTLDHGQQVGEVERLGQIVEGASLGRADRGQKRVLGAHHDDRQGRPAALDARQEVERVLVRQHHIENGDVAGAVLDPAPKGGGGAGRLDAITLPGQRPRDHGADRGIVVGQQHVRFRHLLPLTSPAGRARARRAAGP